MKDAYKQHRRKPRPRMEQPHDHECLVHHCAKEVPEEHGFKLCERHLAKAWAAYELVNGRPEAAPGPDETIDTNDPNTPGAVYFIRVGELLKIGWTTNVYERFRSLKPDAVLHVIPGTRTTESSFHQQFKDHLAKGQEWFYLNKDTTRMIDQIRTPARS